MELKDKFATSSGHWYDIDGTPRYTIIGKNGQERNTTLRDARTHQYLPSVTTILRVAAAPGLERWKQMNVLMAALTLPRAEGESLDDYAERCITDSNEQSKAAMALGTSIHGSLELAYTGKPYPEEHKPHVVATVAAISEAFPDEVWASERSFGHAYGFGGKLDLSSSNVVIDFKTSAFGPEDKKVGYDEHRMQLAAYAVGLGLPRNYRAANVFVSTTHLGHVKLIEWAREDLDDAWQMFTCLLKFWQTKNNYFPAIKEAA